MTKIKGEVSQSKDYPLIVEKDVWVPLCDGSRVSVDIFRPEAGEEKISRHYVATSMVFAKEPQLRLDISSADGVGAQYFTHFHANYNPGGASAVYAGGTLQSYWMVPIIPATS